MKKLVIALLALIILFSCAACNSKPADSSSLDSASSDFTLANIGEWRLTLATSEGEKEFTGADAAKLEAVTLEATTKNKNGEESTSEYTGVKLSDVLNHAGVTDLESLTVEAADGFSADFDKELALKDDTILAWAKNGEPLEGENPLQMVPKSGTGNQFVKTVVRITVHV